jgi:hypothetical protein
MTHAKFVFLAPVLALSLAGCGGGSEGPNYACPTPFTVTDAGRLTHFADGAGRDPRDIAYEAVIAGSGASCTVTRTAVNVTLVIRIAASAGPAVGAGRTSIPYFVRVIDESGTITQGQEFTADFRLSANNPRGSSQEELTLTLPLSGAYRIAIGLKPTQEELNYNRRARQ